MPNILRAFTGYCRTVCPIKMLSHHPVAKSKAPMALIGSACEITVDGTLITGSKGSHDGKSSCKYNQLTTSTGSWRLWKDYSVISRRNVTLPSLLFLSFLYPTEQHTTPAASLLIQEIYRHNPSPTNQRLRFRDIHPLCRSQVNQYA